MTNKIERAVVQACGSDPGATTTLVRDQINTSFGTSFCTKSIQRVISRNHKLIEKLRGRTPRSIVTRRPGELWGIDLTEIRVLFVFRVHVLGVIDYFGSRLIALEPLKSATTDEITAALQRAFASEGAPDRILSDNGAVFTAYCFGAFLDSHGVTHTRTKPGHPWTNGKIERLFLTYKITLAAYCWIICSTKHLAVVCSEFVRYYNETRPHSSWGNRTPDEVYFHRPRAMRATPATFFGGRLEWYRFGY